MALIAEAIARWEGPDRQAEAEQILVAFVEARRQGEADEIILRALPEQARFAGEIVLTSIRLLEAALERSLSLVVDYVSFAETSGYRENIGIGIGERGIDRVDDLGVTREQAEAISSTFCGLLRCLDHRHECHSRVLVLD